MSTNPIKIDVDQWRAEYQANRYLRSMQPANVQSRLEYLKANLWSTDKEGKVVQPRNPENRPILLKLILHVLLELAKRSGSAVIDFDERRFREEATANYVSPKLKAPIEGDRGVFAKFGKRKHIWDAYKEGKLRISPAASYADPSLNSAQKDDELEHWTANPNQQLQIRLVGTDGKEIPAQLGELFRGRTISNYYVWCCAYGYDARLFRDFEAGAVLIVRNELEFQSRLINAMASKFPKYDCSHGPLKYYDTHTTPHENLELPFMKSLRYLYQNEYRFTWQSNLVTDFVPIDLELGSLEDIAEYCELA